MKQMKKTLSLILALVMLLSLGTTAFAGEMGAEEAAVQRVEFETRPDFAVVTVYAGEDEVDAQEDGSYLLIPGEYTYDAAAEGYFPVEKNALTITTVTAETMKVEVVLDAVPVVEEPVVEDVVEAAAVVEEIAEEPVAEEPVVEEPVVEEPVVEEPVVEEPIVEEPAAQEDEKSLIDKVSEFLFGETEDEGDVDEESKTIPHNEDKSESAGNTTVTVSGAPDEATLAVNELRTSTELEEKISEQVEGEVTVVKALDINVDGKLESSVSISLVSPSFIGLVETPSLWHIVDGQPVQVKIDSYNPETGEITFKASSFSPYVITVPDVMNASTKNDDAELKVNLAPDCHIKDGNVQYKIDKSLTPNYIAILDADATWNVTNWGIVNNLEVQMNGHKLNGTITVPAGKQLTITGNNANAIITGNIVSSGSVILVGTGRVKGGITLNSGNLYIDGSNFPVEGLIDAKGSSFVEISSGTYGKIAAEGSCGGHVSGGTFANAVPSNILTEGYDSKKDGDKYIVYMSAEARVKTINGAINFSRNGGNYVEFYKGDANAAQNYSFQFAITPYNKLTNLAILAPNSSTPTPLTGMYTYDAGTDPARVVISKSLVSPLLNSMAAGRAYIQFTINGVLIEVPLNIYPNVTFDPTTYIIDSFQPVVFTITDAPSYITVDLKDGENPYYKRLNASNYTISGNTLTLSSSYLNNMEPGAHNFDFWYDMSFGKTVRLRCTVLVYKDYKIVQINNVEMYKDKNMADVNWYQYSGRNLNFTANGNPDKFSGVKIDGRLISAGNYAVTKDKANGVTNVGLYPGYLASLAQGKHTISVVFTDGEATATFNVLSASSSPKTGDNNNMLLWVSVLVLSGAAVVALIPKKKKQ